MYHILKPNSGLLITQEKVNQASYDFLATSLLKFKNIIHETPCKGYGRDMFPLPVE